MRPNNRIALFWFVENVFYRKDSQKVFLFVLRFIGKSCWDTRIFVVQTSTVSTHFSDRPKRRLQHWSLWCFSFPFLSFPSLSLTLFLSSFLPSYFYFKHKKQTIFPANHSTKFLFCFSGPPFFVVVYYFCVCACSSAHAQRFQQYMFQGPCKFFQWKLLKWKNSL